MSKVLVVNDDGYVWYVPLDTIANNRASYYAAGEEDSKRAEVFKEEFEFTMSDSFEALDWFMNNMNWEDIADQAVLKETPKPLTAPRFSKGDLKIKVTNV